MDHSSNGGGASHDPAAPLQAKRVRFPGYEHSVGPLGHLAAERARLAELSWPTFDVEPVGATIGAEVTGIELASCDDPVVLADLRQALLAFKVLFFRAQDLSQEQHVAFARHFGALETHPFLVSNPDVPELVRFEKSADVGGYENGWHSDVTWRETPSMGAVLRAVQVPQTGGDTLFADAAAAYDGLDPDFRQQVDELVAEHDFAQAFGYGMDDDQLARLHEQYPVVHHPVIRTHPETGRRLIYVNRFFVRSIVGMDRVEGQRIVERLCREIELPEYQCRLRWRPGTVAFWDNRAVQHLACSDYWPDVRIMERASIVGDRPY